MELSRQEHWSELPFPPPGDLPNPRIEPTSTSPALAGGFFTISTPPELKCRLRIWDPWVRKIFWRRKWQPIPVFLPGRSQARGKRSLVGYSPLGLQESDRTEQLNHHHQDTGVCLFVCFLFSQSSPNIFTCVRCKRTLLTWSLLANFGNFDHRLRVQPSKWLRF